MDLCHRHIRLLLLIVLSLGWNDTRASECHTDLHAQLRAEHHQVLWDFAHDIIHFQPEHAQRTYDLENAAHLARITAMALEMAASLRVLEVSPNDLRISMLFSDLGKAFGWRKHFQQDDKEFFRSIMRRLGHHHGFKRHGFKRGVHEGIGYAIFRYTLSTRQAFELKTPSDVRFRYFHTQLETPRDRQRAGKRFMDFLYYNTSPKQAQIVYLHEFWGAGVLYGALKMLGYPDTIIEPLMDGLLWHNGPEFGRFSEVYNLHHFDFDVYERQMDVIEPDKRIFWGLSFFKQFVGPYPFPETLDGVIHSVFDRTDQGQLVWDAHTNEWVGGVRKILYDKVFIFDAQKHPGDVLRAFQVLLTGKDLEGNTVEPALPQASAAQILQLYWYARTQNRFPDLNSPEKLTAFRELCQFGLTRLADTLRFADYVSGETTGNIQKIYVNLPKHPRTTIEFDKTDKTAVNKAINDILHALAQER